LCNTGFPAGAVRRLDREAGKPVSYKGGGEMAGFGRGRLEESPPAERRNAPVRIHLLGGGRLGVEGRLRRSFGELHDIPRLETGSRFEIGQNLRLRHPAASAYLPQRQSEPHLQLVQVQVGLQRSFCSV
jgi:hypothetical protein